VTAAAAAPGLSEPFAPAAAASSPSSSRHAVYAASVLTSASVSSACSWARSQQGGSSANTEGQADVGQRYWAVHGCVRHRSHKKVLLCLAEEPRVLFKWAMFADQLDQMALQALYICAGGKTVSGVCTCTS
jgi:hypothetical protein